MIDYKCWYFAQAIEMGEEAANQIPPEQMPPEIREAWSRLK